VDISRFFATIEVECPQSYKHFAFPRTKMPPQSSKSPKNSRDLAISVLAHLNLSSGTPSIGFLADMNDLYFRQVEQPEVNGGSGERRVRPMYQRVADFLTQTLEAAGDNSALKNAAQVTAILDLAFAQFPKAYLKHHAELLYRFDEELLMTPLFVGRVCEAIIAEGVAKGVSWEPGAFDSEAILKAVITQLCDYIGYRPVPVLENNQKAAPYAGEFVATIPLYIRGAGVAWSPYYELVRGAIEILHTTDEDLTNRSFFLQEQFDELALDPRDFDFSNPASRRPNYLHGQWDLQNVDTSGFSNRFVIHTISLQAMSERVREQETEEMRQFIQFEESSVLAGTILMGSGVSGVSVNSHDSEQTLSDVVKNIADYRDQFYSRLLKKMTGEHGELLLAEAKRLHQPFGGARQAYNRYVNSSRAKQLKITGLARLYARMGYPNAAREQIQSIKTASSRFLCEIDCNFLRAQSLIDNGDLIEAIEHLTYVEDQIKRSIEIGAIHDPWCILGFGAQYNLFTAQEAIPDHRAEELVDLVAGLFGFYLFLRNEAAAVGDQKVLNATSLKLESLASWWDKYATVEVSDVDSISGAEACETSNHLAMVLGKWHAAGTSSGDVAFWRENVDHFQAPKAYANVIEALLERGDPVASMALMMQWLSLSDEISLEEENFSFDTMAVRWMTYVWEGRLPKRLRIISGAAKTAGRKRVPDPLPPEERWPLAKKFLDFLEANAGDYWYVPKLEVGGDEPPKKKGKQHTESDDGWGEVLEDEFSVFDEEGDEIADIFKAAYEGVTFHDSANDGVEGPVHEGPKHSNDFELTTEAKRINKRLLLIEALPTLWKLSATQSAACGAEDRDEILTGWLDQAKQNYDDILDLIDAVSNYEIPAPRATHESLFEYDQHFGIREQLMDRLIAVAVSTADALLLILASMKRIPDLHTLPTWERHVVSVLNGLFVEDSEKVMEHWDDMIEALGNQRLLYIPVARGGSPTKVVGSRTILAQIKRLLVYTPRLGLWFESCELLRTAQDMEMSHPVGPGAVTEFDTLYELACRSIVECLTISSTNWRAKSNRELIQQLQELVEQLLVFWLDHSHNVRLSVLETLKDNDKWQCVKRFIREFGKDIFTQRFLGFANVRAILIEGTTKYLQSLLEDEDPNDESDFSLLTAIEDGKIPLVAASEILEIILECVTENYSEYIDYNSSTTQSDRGDMLYTFLEFLRVQASYDRMAWNMMPIVFAHQVLIWLEQKDVARAWRKAVVVRTQRAADKHMALYEKLRERHGMRLASIADRIAERFTRPMEIDKLISMVRPTIRNARRDGEITPEFILFKQQVEIISEEVDDSGRDMPSWLEKLNQRAYDVHCDPEDNAVIVSDPRLPIEIEKLNQAKVKKQIARMRRDLKS